jgi:dTDP-glucose 4,6-dehydratase
MNFKYNRVLVTGGCGFIGSHYIETLLNTFTNAEIINIDLCTYAVSKKTIESLDSLSKYELVKGSICDDLLINETFKNFQPDLIVNFAAESHVDNSINDPSIFLETNVLGTVNLINSLISSDNKNLKETIFHQISTDEVFGDTDIHSKDLFNEESPIKPSSPYSASKASADHMIRSWHRTFSLNYIITNCGNNFGPRQHFEKLIPTIILNALKEEKIPIYGAGNNIRDWIYVKDHAEILLSIQNSGLINDTFLIGMRNERSNIELVKYILNQMHPNQSYEDFIRFVDDRLGHDFRYALDNSKLEKKLNKKLSSNFEKEIKDTINWYRNNRDWWE